MTCVTYPVTTSAERIGSDRYLAKSDLKLLFYLHTLVLRNYYVLLFDN